MMRHVRLPGDQAQGRRARSRGRDRDDPGAARRAFGAGVPLRIDPNCAWSVRDLGRGRARPDGGAGRRRLSRGSHAPASTAWRRSARRSSPRAIDTPLASNVAVTSFADLPAAVRQDAVQIVLCDPHYWGGMRQVQHLAQALPDVRPRPVDALEQPPRRVADGDGARRRGHAAPHLRLRHALPVAARRGRGRGRRPHARSRTAPCGSRTARDSASISITTQLARGRERYAKLPVPQARRRSRDAQARRSRLDASSPALVTHP